MRGGAPQLYPWQNRAWGALEKLLGSARPPHGLLLSGPPGAGLGRFIERLQYFLFCEQQRDAANAAKAERLLATGAHPDLLSVSPEAPARVIRVAQVRELARFWELGSRFDGARVVLLEPAEALQRGACDALLKLLEEAPPGALLVLRAHRPPVLPATLRSRCLRLAVSCPPTPATLQWLRARLPPGEDAAAWLRLTRAGPLAVLEMVEQGEGALRKRLEAFLAGEERQPVPLLAAHWQEQGAARVLYWLRCLVFDHIRLRLAGRDPQPPGRRLSLRSLIDYHGLLVLNQRELESSGGAREVSLLEESIISWRRPHS